MHHQFRLASICLLLSVVAVAPACSQEGLTILPTRDSSSLSEVPGSPTTSRGNTGIPVVSPRESQTQIMGSPACELSPPLPPGVASFRYGPTHNPDSVQEILTATPLGQTIGGGNVLPDFGSTIGQQMSPAKPVASPSTTSAREGSIAGASVLATAMFAGPAHFALGGHFTGGSLSDDRPVVIYEGMTVTAAADGRYEVRCVVEAPDSNVILKLQLQIQNMHDPGAIGTITLAPITLTSSTADDSDQDYSVMAGATRTWVIRRTGYSHLLASPQYSDRQCLTVTRSGTIRIGQSPDSYTSY